MGKTAWKDKEMPFLDHLEELRWRILKSLAAIVVMALLSFFFSNHLLVLLERPARSLDPPPQLIFLKPVGMFMVRLEIGLIGGLVLALPFVLYQAWLFIGPGLFEHERRYVPAIIGFSVLCFLLGAALAYFAVIPIALRFMIRMGTESIEPRWDINAYIGFLLQLIVGFGAVFQLPILSYFLSRIGILTPRFLRTGRPYAIVVIFVVAAFLTPPDVVSQLLMAIPLVVLYEVSILVSLLAHRTSKKGSVE